MATYKQLSYGSSGDDVKRLQERLNENNAGLEVDGQYGPATEAAVKKYQRENGLDVDGIAGDQTWGSLEESAAANQQPATSTQPSQPGMATTPSGASATVQQAQQLLSQYQPTGYTSSYSKPISETIQEILTRKPFEYDVASDPLYQNFRDYYQRNGQLAMEDTMGQAAAMTGGYGNSYAQQVGQQTYQGYMTELSDKIPELHQLALDKYNAETAAMYDRANLLSSMENQDYDRWYTEQKWKQEYGSPIGESSPTYSGGGTNVGTGYGSGSGYNSGGVSAENIKKMQQAMGVAVDGIWGPESSAAAGGVSADAAWANYSATYESGNAGNTGLNEATIKAMQRYMGLPETGVWDHESQNLAGGRTAEETWRLLRGHMAAHEAQEDDDPVGYTDKQLNMSEMNILYKKESRENQHQHGISFDSLSKDAISFYNVAKSNQWSTETVEKKLLQAVKDGTVSEDAAIELFAYWGL